MLLTTARQRRLLAFLLLALFLIYWIPFSNAFPGWVPLQFSSYRIFQATTIAMWAIVALGLNILTGYNGQISLGHGAFVALGGYTSAILIFDHNWPFWATIPIAGLLTGAIGFLVGLPALRLTGPYLAIATLALALSTPQILQKYEGLTHGSQGINIDSPTPPGALNDILNDTQYLYFLALLVAFIMAIVAWNIVRSRVGRAFVAIRDSEIAAQSMGVNLAIYKSIAFAYSAALMGLAGALFAHKIAYLAPDIFNILLSIQFLLLVIVGGLGSLHGAVFGAIFVALLPPLIAILRDSIPASMNDAAVAMNIKLIAIIGEGIGNFLKKPGVEAGIFGLILVLVILLEPLGMYGRWVKIRVFFSTFPMYRGATFKRQKSYMRSERLR